VPLMAQRKRTSEQRARDGATAARVRATLAEGRTLEP